MLSVLEVAARLDRDPETIRRWIRSGKLRATKVGLQHMVDEADLPYTDDDVAGPGTILTTPSGARIAKRDILQALEDTRAGR